MLDRRIDRGLQALVLQLDLSCTRTDDTFALLRAVANHCGHALAVDGSLLEHAVVDGSSQTGHVNIVLSLSNLVPMQTLFASQHMLPTGVACTVCRLRGVTTSYCSQQEKKGVERQVDAIKACSAAMHCVYTAPFKPARLRY